MGPGRGELQSRLWGWRRRGEGMAEKKTLSYKDAGVDIEYAEKMIDKISSAVKSTFRPEVLSDLGGFGGFFKINTASYSDPVLVSSTDGVGTKLKLAFKSGIHNTVGIDLVAMCINDVIVSGAEPLFMLDYISTGNLKSIPYEEIISGIVAGCREAGCSLIGGETAEMPGMYRKGEYDLAGFAVGVVEQEKIIDGSNITSEDVLIGLASSGLHSNGFSLVRKVLFDRKKYDINHVIPDLGVPLIEELMKPTKIYAHVLQFLLKNFDIHGIAHITGGGIPGNLPRILPHGTAAIIKKRSWEVLPIFKIIQREGNIPEEEMWRTFNMGIGMILVVSRNDADQIVESLTTLGEKAYIIGEIKSEEGKGRKVIIEGEK